MVRDESSERANGGVWEEEIPVHIDENSLNFFESGLISFARPSVASIQKGKLNQRPLVNKGIEHVCFGLPEITRVFIRGKS